MGWKDDLDSFLKMMKVNHKIFGKEILQINSANEEFLIRYFEDRLSKILDWEIFINTEYSDVTWYGDGSPKDITLNKNGFGLNIEECIKIFDYIYGRIYHKEYSILPQLHWTDSVVVLNYIKHRYPLTESKYKFIKYEDGIYCRNYDW